MAATLGNGNITFGDSTVQSTAAVPLTGGTMTGVLYQANKPYWFGRISGGEYAGTHLYMSADSWNGGWTHSSNRYLYPPVSGWYKISWAALNQSANEGTEHGQVFLYKNGVNQNVATNHVGDKASAAMISVFMYVSSSDYIHLRMGQGKLHTDQRFNKFCIEFSH